MIQGQAEFEKAASLNAIRRVNLGCGKFPLEGYVNVDAHEPADIMRDVWECAFVHLDEVRMDHFLEHISHRLTAELLWVVHGWLKPGGLLVVEVPDMRTIMQMTIFEQENWQRYVYGSQQHEGEYHRAGFTGPSLRTAIEDAGFRVIEVKRFESEFKTRIGMPCLKAQAIA